MMKIDIFNHFFPTQFFDKMQVLCKDPQVLKRYINIPVLVEADARFKVMDEFGEYCQILSLPNPPIEAMATPEDAPELAKYGNDGLAEYCQKYPDRFPGFIASLPLNNPDAAVEETHRAMRDLGAKGIQLFTNVAGKSLDAPEFAPLFDAMVEYDMPIWVHPTRGMEFSDFAQEDESLYEIWWTLGWPYETSVFMSRMVFSGLFDRLPDIKIITHHMGAMIPFFEGRVGPGWDQIGKRTVKYDYQALLEKLEKRPLDYFKMFYADTALFGSRSGTVCGLDFFGVDKTVFASDSPFDPEGGGMYIRDTISVLDSLDISEEDRKKIYYDNAVELMKLEGI